jgi:hypothetical protein
MSSFAILPRGSGDAFWTPFRLRALRHGLWFSAAFALLIAATDIVGTGFGFDAHAYWTVWRHDGLYTVGPQQLDAYLYSPAFAQVMWPLTLLPWAVFCIAWTAALAAIYVWLLAPLAPRWRIPLLALCTLDLVAGNIWAFFALVLVFGIRYPAAWAFPLLTKITPIVGPVWFLARREWESFALVAMTTVAITTISVAIAPHLWSDWVHFLMHTGDPASSQGTKLQPLFHPPTALWIAVDLPIAVAITVIAARSNRPWLLPVAMVFAMPFFSVNAMLVLAAIPRIRERSLSAPRPAT